MIEKARQESSFIIIRFEVHQDPGTKGRGEVSTLDLTDFEAGPIITCSGFSDSFVYAVGEVYGLVHHRP